MRRGLILIVAATVSMVLLAMLVPMAVLVRSYALEDRLFRAALDVQATETVVSSQDKGAVANYLDRVNRDGGEGGDARTTVLYPDGTGVGPDPGEDRLVRQARRTGQARVDDVAGGSQILVPVARGGRQSLPARTPVIRVIVPEPAIVSEFVGPWLVLLLLGLALLAGSLLLADRLGRSFVQPIRALAAWTQRLGGARTPEPAPLDGPAEVRDLSAALNRLTDRIQLLLAREREAVADLSHRLRTPITALRLRVDMLADTEERERIGADLDRLEEMVDHIVREARRSEREGLDPHADAAAVLSDRVRFWAPLAEDQERPFALDAEPAGALPGDGVPAGTVRASEADLVALVDVLLDNVFTHTPEGSPIAVRVRRRASGGVELVVDDAGPGYPPATDVAGRGTSGSGSTGLGLAIVRRTVEESGGELLLERSPQGGARARVVLGPS